MEFKPLTDIVQLNEIDEKSKSKTQVLFKHSTRCSVSRMAMKNLLDEMAETYLDKLDIFYLDLLNYRAISNAIAARYKIRHESPQILVIKNGKCVAHASHSEVSLKLVN